MKCGKSAPSPQLFFWHMKIFWTWAIVVVFFVHVYKAFWSGGEGRIRGAERVGVDLKCFAPFLLLSLLFATISSSEKSHLCSRGGCKRVKVPRRAALASFSAAKFAIAANCSFSFTTFYLNLRIYLHKTVRSDEPSRQFQFHWRWGRRIVFVFCDLKKKREK